MNESGGGALQRLQADNQLLREALFENTSWTIEALATAMFVEHLMGLDEVTMEEAVKGWEARVGALCSKDYEGGKHMGDCVDVPTLCMRCAVERFRTQATDLWFLLKRNRREGYE